MDEVEIVGLGGQREGDRPDLEPPTVPVPRSARTGDEAPPEPDDATTSEQDAPGVERITEDPDVDCAAGNHGRTVTSAVEATEPGRDRGTTTARDLLRRGQAEARGERASVEEEVEDLLIDVCSQCHPFFTGRQKLVDTEGRVARFRRKYRTTQEQK